MAAIDDLVGIIPVAVGAGVVMKVTESMFGSANRIQQQSPARRRKSTRRRTTQRSNGTGFGNFSNVGFF